MGMMQVKGRVQRHTVTVIQVSTVGAFVEAQRHAQVVLSKASCLPPGRGTEQRAEQSRGTEAGSRKAKRQRAESRVERRHKGGFAIRGGRIVVSKHGVSWAEAVTELPKISTGFDQQLDPRDASPACGLVQQAVVVRVRVHLCLCLYQALGCPDCLMLEGSFHGAALSRMLLIHICTVAQKEADQRC